MRWLLKLLRSRNAAAVSLVATKDLGPLQATVAIGATVVAVKAIEE